MLALGMYFEVLTLKKELLTDQLTPAMRELPLSTWVADVGTFQGDLENEIPIVFAVLQIERSTIEMVLQKREEKKKEIRFI